MSGIPPYTDPNDLYGGNPSPSKATLFAFCLGLLACNAVALLKGALRAEHGEEVVSQQLSAYYLVLEIRQTDAGMMVAIPAACWSVFESLTDGQ